MLFYPENSAFDRCGSLVGDGGGPIEYWILVNARVVDFGELTLEA